METTPGEAQAVLFAQHFAPLPDPRQRLPQHPLLSMLFIVLAAQLCGAEGWDAMAAFARAKQGWLSRFFAFPKGVPSADTLRWGMATVDPKAVAACFQAWVDVLAHALRGEVIAVDGQARSLDVSFREDHCRIRDLRAAENVAMVRRMALQLLKRQPGETVGLPIRRLRAGWDNGYLVQVLSTGLT
ncbi:MAG: ISAs1 family transposase [Candidatus Binatia bacterium]